MAKQMGILRFKGRLGQSIGLSNGTVRAEGKTPSNPKSTAQCIQRMICATAAQAMSKLQIVCSNSVQGKKRGNETMSYLRGEWMRMLRVSDIFGAANNYGYVKKGSQLLALNPYMISRGSLTPISAEVDGDYEAKIHIPNRGPATASVVATELFPTVELGNQITFLIIKQNPLMTIEGEFPYVVSVCRFAFKDNSVPALIEDSGVLYLNPDAIDLTKASGAWKDLVFEDEQLVDVSSAAFIGARLGAAAVIQSNINNNQRSTEFLSVASDAVMYPFPAVAAVDTYGANGTPIDTESEVYLNNSTLPTAAGGSSEHTANSDWDFPYLFPKGSRRSDEISGLPVGGNVTDLRFRVSVPGTGVVVETANLTQLADEESIFKGVTLPEEYVEDIDDYLLYSCSEMTPTGEVNVSLDIPNSGETVRDLIIMGGYITVNGVQYNLV